MPYRIPVGAVVAIRCGKDNSLGHVDEVDLETERLHGIFVSNPYYPGLGHTMANGDFTDWMKYVAGQEPTGRLVSFKDITAYSIAPSEPARLIEIKLKADQKEQGPEV
jgi:hypothetical protein